MGGGVSGGVTDGDDGDGRPTLEEALSSLGFKSETLTFDWTAAADEERREKRRQRRRERAQWKAEQAERESVAAAKEQLDKEERRRLAAVMAEGLLL